VWPSPPQKMVAGKEWIGEEMQHSLALSLELSLQTSYERRMAKQGRQDCSSCRARSMVLGGHALKGRMQLWCRL